MMRVTGSRVYSRPAPVPKMPPGLVEIMEGLTKEVLRNNPQDVYAFCASHMEKLLEIRDGPSNMKPLSLKQKITRAQEKVKKRAEQHWRKIDEEKEKENIDETNDAVEKNSENESLFVESVNENLFKPLYKCVLKSESELEISCEPGNSSIIHKVIKEEPNEGVDNVTDSVKDPLENLIDITKNSAGHHQYVQNITESEKNITVQDFTELNNLLHPSEINDDPNKETTQVRVITSDTDEIDSINIMSLITEYEIQNKETSNEEENILNSSNVKEQPQPSNHDEESMGLSESTCNINGDNNELLSDYVNENHIKNVTEDIQKRDKNQSSINKINDALDEKVNDTKLKKLSILLLPKPEEQPVSFSKESKADLQAIDETSGTTSNDTPNHDTKINNVEKTNQKLDMSKKDIYKIKNLSSDSNSEIGTIFQNGNSDGTSNDSKNSCHGREQILVITTENVFPHNHPVEKKTESNDVINNLTHIDKVSINNYELIQGDAKKLKDEDSKDYNNSNETSTDGVDDVKIETVNYNNGETKKSYDQPTVQENIALNNDIHNHTANAVDKSSSIDDSTNAVDKSSSIDDSTNAVDKSSSIDDSTNEDQTMDITTDCSEDATQNDTTNGMDLETAAVTIQKVFRTFLFKSRASMFDESTNEDNILSDEDDNSEEKKEDRSFMPSSLSKERRTLGISRMDTVLQTVNEEKSLSLSTDDSSLSSAATIIQAHVRGFLVRNKLCSGKTVSSNSLINSSDGQAVSLDSDIEQHKNKTILNIHIVPEGGNYLSRDESMITSMDLSLDGSPPSSINLHPLGYDISERRKQLKREDAIQSISPPSNNSGKLSEDSVKELPINESQSTLEQETISVISLKEDLNHESDVASIETSSTNSITIDTVLEDQKSKNDQSEILSSPELASNTPGKNGRILVKQSSDEMDVVTPFKDSATPRGTESTSGLLHSGEFHDTVLPTKVSRNDTPVASEFKNVLVYFLLWNNS